MNIMFGSDSFILIKRTWTIGEYSEQTLWVFVFVAGYVETTDDMWNKTFHVSKIK